MRRFGNAGQARLIAQLRRLEKPSFARILEKTTAILRDGQQSWPPQDEVVICGELYLFTAPRLPPRPSPAKTALNKRKWLGFLKILPANKDKEARLAEALRANLQRRKAQTRGRVQAPDAAPEASENSDAPDSHPKESPKSPQ